MARKQRPANLQKRRASTVNTIHCKTYILSGVRSIGQLFVAKTMRPHVEDAPTHVTSYQCIVECLHLAAIVKKTRPVSKMRNIISASRGFQ